MIRVFYINAFGSLVFEKNHVAHRDGNFYSGLMLMQSWQIVYMGI
jgi:hypothetical protein